MVCQESSAVQVWFAYVAVCLYQCARHGDEYSTVMNMTSASLQLILIARRKRSRQTIAPVLLFRSGFTGSPISGE